tara:strand:- start:2273 stop:2944 length:672 start_codon:yes stop_codon:yes gene_type:complete
MITVFLPCRAGSDRVINKNTRPFLNKNTSLLSIKLKQLLNVKNIDNIIVSTNDKLVIEICKEISKKIIIDKRPENLALSSTSTDDLISYVPKIINEGIVLWTHTTSPFIDEITYNEAINLYLKFTKEKTYDSLMTVNKIQTYLWHANESYNYDRTMEKWPRTQTLKQLFEVNSGIFINSIDNFRKFKDRIGVKPFMMQLNHYQSFDIDWPDDFKFAEKLFELR